MLMTQWFWRKRFFLNFVKVFSLFWYNSSWKRAGLFIWTNLNFIHPRMLWAKFGWNLPCDSFKNFVKVYSLFCSYLPLEKGGALHLNKESSSPNNALCQVSLKLAQWLNFINILSLFCCYLLLEKGWALDLNNYMYYT